MVCALHARCIMPLAARVLMAALAAFGVWTMIRACRSGTIYSEGSGYNIDERPVTFSLTLVAHGLGVAFLRGWRPATTRRASCGFLGSIRYGGAGDPCRAALHP